MLGYIPPGRHPPPGQTPPADTPGRHPLGRHPQQTATAPDGTRPTGMHSCFVLWYHRKFELLHLVSTFSEHCVFTNRNHSANTKTCLVRTSKKPNKMFELREKFPVCCFAKGNYVRLKRCPGEQGVLYILGSLQLTPKYYK